MENLNVLLPELLDKLKVVEEKKPVNNVTTNIIRIRELIAQARSVAKKVSASHQAERRTFRILLLQPLHVLKPRWFRS